MTYLKHDSNGNQSKRSKPAKKAEEEGRVVVTGPESGHMPKAPLQHDINYVAGMSGIEESLDWIAQGLGHLTSDSHTVNLCVGQGEKIYSIKLTLAENDFDDTMSRVVTAFERIADSLARLAGLSRPRLETWRDQDEQMPRDRDICTNGGAPGPNVEVTVKLKRCNTAMSE